MEPICLTAQGVRKDFNHRPVFSEVSFTLENGQTLAVCGRNGSGKSTLLKIIASLLSPTSGTIALTVGGSPVPSRGFFRHIGMVAPYLHLYEEFTALENLMIIDGIRGGNRDGKKYEELLAMVTLEKRKHDMVRTFSSGMKQRLKYALAWMDRPPVLLLDEPRTNLDTEGIGMVHGLFAEQKRGGIVIIATNEHDDAEMCDSSINIGEMGGKPGGRP